MDLDRSGNRNTPQKASSDDDDNDNDDNDNDYSIHRSHREGPKEARTFIMVRGKSNASEKQDTNKCNDASTSSSKKKRNGILEKDAPIESKKKAGCDHAGEEGVVQEEEEEVWDQIRVIPTAEETIKCRYEHCSEQAVATWATNTNPDDKWSVCEKCQLEDFGGWPEGVYPIERTPVIPTSTSTLQVTHTIPSKDGATPTEPITTTKTCASATCTDHSKNDDDIPLPKASTMDEPFTIAPQDKAEIEDPPAATSEEKYELTSIVSLETLCSNPIKCSGREDCNLPACSIWTATNDPKKWYYCIDCQEQDFGGWPTPKELPCDFLSKDHLFAIAKRCSKKLKPTMPVFASKCVTPNLSLLSPNKNKGGSAAAAAAAAAASFPPKVLVSGETKTPSISPAAMARHEKWLADAKKLGVNRIIVNKDEAKKVIFEALYDAFRPMSSANIYIMLKKMIPLPVLKYALSDMSKGWGDDDGWGSDDDDDENIAEWRKQPYAGSIYFKPGRNAASSVYYVDHNKIKEMGFDEKQELLEKVANTKAQYNELTFVLKEFDTKTTRLLVEPTNDALMERLNGLENDVATLTKDVNDAKALTVNESHKKKLKRRIQSMAGHYRKRKQLCCSFLSSLEEISDGAISKKKCLKGDGQIALDSDETINKAAIAYAKMKKNSKEATKVSLANENFVGIALDSQKMIKRVYVDDEE